MSQKKQNSSGTILDQKWQSLQDSILAAEAIIAEETAQSADTEKLERLLTAQKKLAEAKKLLGDISAGMPAMQKLGRLASFPELNFNPILEISIIGAVKYINPAAQKLFPDLQEKGSAHPFLADWQELVERVFNEPDLYLDREIRVEGCYYQQTVIYNKEYNCFRLYGYDITKRKNAEQALQQSELRFRTLIDAAPVAIALSRESKFLYVNPAYLDLHGIDNPAELLGHPIYERVAPESQQDSLVRADRHAHGLPDKMPYEYMALRKDGSLVPVIAAVTSVTLADGPATVGFFQDIRQIKQIQKERDELLAQVQMERDRLRSLLENMNDEVWFCDPDGKILLANRAAMQNIGYNSPDELLTTVSALVEDLEFYNSDGTPRSADQVAFTRTLMQGTTVFGEDIVRNRRTGELKYREYNTALIRSEKGQIMGAVAVVRDISRRKLAEQALHQNQAILNAILNGTPDPVFLKDRDSRILLANPATLAAIGKPAEQVIGKTDAEFYDDPAVGYAIMANDRRVMETGQTEVVEEQILAPGGQRVFLSTKTPYRDADGNILGVIGISRDITDRKKRETELYQLGRTLRAISNSNQALMRAENETQFMDQVCDIIVKDCGYKMVWIGMAKQDNAKSVQPIASAGFEQGYLDTLNITWADTERGQGPTGTAIRTGKPSLCRDMRTDPKFKPWYAEAIKRGYASSLVLPLLSDGQAFGALTIYSETLDPFSDDEVKLLSELANDLAYGITMLRLRDAHLKAEEALKESEEKYRRLIENVTDLVCEVDSQARFLFVNAQYEQNLGYKPGELIGKYTHELIHPEDLQYSTPAFQKLVDGKLISHNEWRFKHKNGEWRWFDCIGQSYEKSPGDRRVVVISRDITERKQTEENLQKVYDELEQRVQERTEQLQIINQELNAEIVERKQAEEIIRQNATRAENLAEISRRLAAAGLRQQGVCDIISQSVSELIGETGVVRLLSVDGQQLNLASIYHKDLALRENMYRIMRDLPIKVGEGISGKVITNGRSFFLPSTAPHKLMHMVELQEQPVVEGLQIHSLMCVPLRQEERIIGTITVIGSSQRKPYTQEELLFLEDLAGRAGLSLAKARLYHELENALEREKETRVQLIQSEKNSALARMVASVAHEINNPVQTIKNCMYLLSNSIDQASPSGEILNMATSEANRIGDLVSRLRDLYRPSKELALKTINILDVLFDVNALLEPHLQHNKIKMDIETCSDRVYVTANADQIKQVFLNISLNAIDAMQPAGGRLTAKLSCPTALQTCISFIDSGKGISSEEMQHIFEPLYTTKEKGTGLGLAISHEIVKNHNGFITVESESGKGATFSVWLPITDTGEAGSQ